MRLIEIFLLQFVVYLALWLWDDYVALLLTLIFVGILLSVLVIAFVSEKIEQSKVSSRYFKIMWLSILAPILAMVIMKIAL